MPLFSIITTCRNASACIAKTIESILKQDFRDFEYLIMDGCSTDDTLRIAASYAASFQDAGIPYHVFSEKDHGIYEGMNHGVSHSNGEYLNFMNAGDCLYETDTLRRVANHIDSVSDSARPDLIYGDAVAVEFDQTYRYGKDLRLIEQRMPFSHQSVFAARELLLAYPLREDLRIGSDYDFLLTAYQNGAVFSDAGSTICTVTLDGLSSVDLIHTFEETVAIQRAHGIDLFPGSAYDKKLRSYRVKQFVMDHFPRFMIRAIRKIQRIKRGQNEHC